MKKNIICGLLTLLGCALFVGNVQAYTGEENTIMIDEEISAQSGDYITKRFHLEKEYNIVSPELSYTISVDGSVTYNYKTGEIEDYMENYSYTQETGDKWQIVGFRDQKSRLISNFTTIVYTGQIAAFTKNIYGDSVTQLIPYELSYTPAAE